MVLLIIVDSHTNQIFQQQILSKNVHLIVQSKEKYRESTTINLLIYTICAKKIKVIAKLEIVNNN